jgi:hypothetical protein
MAATIDFSTTRHRDFISRRGESVAWQKALPCSCRNPISGEYDRTHSTCGGTGYLYTTQSVSDYRALLRDVSHNQVLASFGALMLGDLICTTMPDEIPVAVGDLLVIPGRTFRTAHNVVRARGNPPVDTKLDALRCTPVSSITRVWDAGHGEYTQNGVGVVGPEYELSGDSVKWLTPGGDVHNPARDSVYSAEYRYSPTYIAIPERLSIRRPIDGVFMPQRAVLRLKNPEDFRT